MPIDATRVALAAKTAIDAIDYKNGSVGNSAAIEAMVSAILDELLANAEVVVTGGSSAGTYKIT